MRRGRVAAVLASAVYVGVLIAAWSLIENVNDYAGFVAGARALLAGQNPYDPATWPDLWQQLGTQKPDTAVFGYPAWIVIAFLPLAPLPVGVGSLVWNLGTLALAVLGARALARECGLAPMRATVLAGASWPAFLVFLQGQWAYLLFALAVAAYRDLVRARDGRAGVWWALAVLAKPQLFLVGSAMLAAFLVRERRWRALVTAAITVAIAAGVSALVLPGWWTPWLENVAARRIVRSTQQPTLAGLAGDVAGDAWPIAWLVFVVALAVAIGWAVTRAREHRAAIAFGGFLTLSVAASAYSWSYDQYLVVFAGIVTLALAETHPQRRAITWATYALYGPVALGLWLSAFARFHDTGSGLLPPLAIALLLWAATPRSVRAVELLPR